MKKIIFIFFVFFIFSCQNKEIINDNQISENTTSWEIKETKEIDIFDINEKIKLNITTDFQNKKIDIPNLMFHYIEDVPKNTKDQLRYNLSFSPKKFEELLILLNENNIETLTFWDLKDILEWKKDIPKKAIILWFDDGHLDHYTEAFPLLEKYNKKWVFFVVSNFPENDQNYMNWEQIIKLKNVWHEIGWHSFSHPNLASLKENSLQKEILDSKRQIEEKIEKKIISFAYPIWKYNNLVLEYTKREYLFWRTTQHSSIIDTNNLFLIWTIRITPEYNIKNILKFYEK